MRYTYLLINLFTILIPFLFSFGKRMQYYRQWQYTLPAMGIAASLFWVWDYAAVRHGLWGYSPAYLTGYHIANLPIEEVLFFITVPYSSVFIYRTLWYYLPAPWFGLRLRYILLFTTIVFGVGALLVWTRIYTSSVLVVAAVLYPIAMRVLDRATMDKFIATYLVSLIPMAIVNGILTALPIVWYNPAYHLGYRIGTIPIEDFVYWFDLLLLNILLYEGMKPSSID